MGMKSFFLSDEEINAFYAGTSTRAGSLFGCRYLAEACARRFCLWAPNARSVSVVGDFNDWDDTANPMETYRGLWACFADAAKNGDNYKYCIVGADGARVLKADPYAVYAETPPNTASKVWDIGDYAWTDRDYLQKRAKTDLLHSPLSIYELHVGSWRTAGGSGEGGVSAAHESDTGAGASAPGSSAAKTGSGAAKTEYPSFRCLADELAGYVKQMGFTHVELMPVNAYPFDGSWGYQVTGFFAITSRFGTPQDFMYFVDRLHAAGIGVIVDWVPAHFPKDAHGLPYFDGTWLYEHKDPLRREHPQWGTHEFNYNRPEVKSFLISSAVSLIDQYHVDGLRVDAVSSMLYLDYGRDGDFPRNRDGGNIDYAAVDFLRALNTAVLGGRPGVLTAAEESTAFPLVTKPPYDGGLGFLFKWNMGYMHDTLDFMKIDPYFRHGAHGKMTFTMHYAFSENFILPYSHDEVVHGKASMINKMFGDYGQKFSALRTLYGFLFGHPGKKLLFMGNEFAQFIEWDFQKQLDWHLLDYPAHAGMQAWVRALNCLYRKQEALYQIDDSWDGFQWLNVDDRHNSVFAFMRSGEGGGGDSGADMAREDGSMAGNSGMADGDMGGVPGDGGVAREDGGMADGRGSVVRPDPPALAEKTPTEKAHVVCVCNFSPTAQEEYLVALPGDGTLTLLLSSDEAVFGGGGARVKKHARARDIAMNGQPYAARLALPPLSALFYRYRLK